MIDYEIKQLSRVLSVKDKIGAICVTLGFRRNTYRITPGICRIGEPDKDSPVIATCNFKLTTDIVRSNLFGLNIWLLALDTKGVNVWCAAGKGTFGTDELVMRMQNCKLENLVANKLIILPQLGAPGVCAKEVARRTGFKVLFGPVRIQDFAGFLANNNSASKKMRTVSFTLTDRMRLVMIEVLHSMLYVGPMILILLLSGQYTPPFYGAMLWVRPVFLLSQILSGAVMVPLFLPLLPPRSFALKALICSLPFFLLYYLLLKQGLLVKDSVLCYVVADSLMFFPFAGWLGLNFTGSTTFTNMTGVKKETRIAVPILLAAFVAGIIFNIFNFTGVV